MFQQNGQTSFHDLNFSKQNLNINEPSIRRKDSYQGEAPDFKENNSTKFHDNAWHNAGNSQSSGRA